MTRKLRRTHTDDPSVRPISAKERRRLQKRLQKQYAEFRGRYREIHGKVVDWLHCSFEEGTLYISIRFDDKTEFALEFSPQIVTNSIDLVDISTGEGKLIREYHKRQGR